MRLSTPTGRRAGAVLLAAALALPVAVPALAQARAGAGQLRRSRREAAAGGGEHLVQPDRAARAATGWGRKCRCSRRARRSSSSSSDFLDRNRPGQHGDRAPQAPPRRMQSLGSGFIIDPTGIVVTNNHVIEGADEITVTLQDNTSLKATLVGRDERTDIAVLKVTSEKPLPARGIRRLRITSRVGDWVLAIGNPFGLGGSVTAGIVSRPRPRHPAGPVRQLHPDRCRHQPRQFRRPAVQHGRRGDRHQHGDLLAFRRLDRHRLLDPVQHGQDRGRAVARLRPRQARLAGGEDPAGHARHRREHGAEGRLRRAGGERGGRRAGRQGEAARRRHHPQVQRPGRKGDAQPAAHRRRDRDRPRGAGDGVARRPRSDAERQGRRAARRPEGRRRGARQAGAAQLPPSLPISA